MKKRILVLAAMAMLAMTVTACGGKVEKKPAATTAVETQESAAGTAGETVGATESADGTLAEDESEGTMTGTIDVNKGMMIVLVDDEDSEAYVFPLDEAQGETYKDLKSGDKVTVSYENGKPSPDNVKTVVTDIQIVK